MSDEEFTKIGESEFIIGDTIINFDDIALGLRALMQVQRFISSGVDGCIVENPGTDQVLTYGHALIHEVGEWMDEMEWKPWKVSKFGGSPFRIADEWADILAFAGVLIYYMNQRGISPEHLAEAYLTKTRTNYRRISGEVEGYEINKGYGDARDK